MMWCWYYRRRFQSYLDHPDSSRPVFVPRHIESCPSCGQYARQVLRVHETLCKPAAEPSDDAQVQRIRSAVLGMLSEQQPGSAPTEKHWMPSPAARSAIAAGLLLLLGLWAAVSFFSHRRSVLLSDLGTLIPLSLKTMDSPLTYLAGLPEQSIRKEVGLLAADAHRMFDVLKHSVPQSAEAGTLQEWNALLTESEEGRP